MHRDKKEDVTITVNGHIKTTWLYGKEKTK